MLGMLIKERISCLEYSSWQNSIDIDDMHDTVQLFLGENNFLNIKMSDLGGEKYNDINFGYKIMTLIEKEILPTTFLVNKTK